MMKSILIYYSYLFHLIPLMINLFMIIMLMNSVKSKFHPITLMIMLILTTFLISLMMNLIYQTLMSFILFLAMIGGLMIIFLYITSLTNNEFFYLNLKLIIMNIIKITPLIFIIMFMLNSYFHYNMFFMNSQDFWKINLFQFTYDQMNMNIIYNKIFNKTSLFIMLYIYYTMICIMNICYKLKLPLRKLIN